MGLLYDVFEHKPDGKRLAGYDREVTGADVDSMKAKRAEKPEDTYLLARCLNDKRHSVWIDPNGVEIETPPWEREQTETT